MVVWPLYLFAFFIGFVVLEGLGFNHPTERFGTLSRFMWRLGQKFPLSLVFFGMLCGGLAVHFYWQWCPALGSTNG